MFSRTAPIATIQPRTKENKPSAELCKPSPVRGRTHGCSSFPHPLPRGVILYSCTGVSLLFAGVSRLGHIAKGCRGTRGMAVLGELLPAVTPGHRTGNVP